MQIGHKTVANFIIIIIIIALLSPLVAPDVD